MEIDLRKILHSRFELNGRTYSVEYEGLNLICFSCGRYGHRNDTCPSLQEECHEDPAGPAPVIKPKVGHQPKELFGPWMIVQRNKGRRGPYANAQSSKGSLGAPQRVMGSKFAVLPQDTDHHDQRNEEETTGIQHGHATRVEGSRATNAPGR